MNDECFLGNTAFPVLTDFFRSWRSCAWFGLLLDGLMDTSWLLETNGQDCVVRTADFFTMVSQGGMICIAEPDEWTRLVNLQVWASLCNFLRLCFLYSLFRLDDLCNLWGCDDFIDFFGLNSLFDFFTLHGMDDLSVFVHFIEFCGLDGMHGFSRLEGSSGFIVLFGIDRVSWHEGPDIWSEFNSRGWVSRISSVIISGWQADTLDTQDDIASIFSLLSLKHRKLWCHNLKQKYYCYHQKI